MPCPAVGHCSASQPIQGEVKLQSVSSLSSLERDNCPCRKALRSSFRLLNLKLSRFPLPVSARPQLMLMSVLTCLFESLNHVLR